MDMDNTFSVLQVNDFVSNIMEEQTESLEPHTVHLKLSQVDIKNETGSNNSLLSVDSPVLQTNSPKFVISKAIEMSIEKKFKSTVTENTYEFETTPIKPEPDDELYLINQESYRLPFNQVPPNKNNQFSNDIQNLESQNDDQYSKNIIVDEDIEEKKRLIIENETTVYRCQECDQVFRKYSEYKMHRTEHSIEKRTCKICHILFQGIVKLNEHMNVHKGIKPFKCSKCKKSFISAHTLKCHMECHRTENSYKCLKCLKCFKTKRSLRGHMDTHAKKIKEYTCKICNQEFDFSTEYRRHLSKHGAEPPEPKCTICNKLFKYESQLKTHLTSHKELKFPCEYCNKVFASMTKIRKHVKRTHIINECEFCKKVFYDKAEFGRHKRTEHIEEKPSICKFCNKAYDKFKNLQEHIRVQHTEDGLENKCEFCEKTFINRFLLNNHVKTHDKCFRCPSCNMQFASRYNLQLHSVTHTNEKKFKCTLCPKAYSTKVSLQTHTSTHYEERPFVCSQCDKTFKNNRRLYVHRKSHETELKFECYTCGNKFKAKEYLKAHLYKHYKVKPFECTQCARHFKHRKTLEKHLEAKHDIPITRKRNFEIIENSNIKQEIMDIDSEIKEEPQQNKTTLNVEVRVKKEKKDCKERINNTKTYNTCNRRKEKYAEERFNLIRPKIEPSDE